MTTRFNITSFKSLAKYPAVCDKLLMRHQVSLMRKEVEKAMIQFEQLYEIRSTHLKIMEEELLPLYKSVLNEFPKGGKPLYFIREKKLILKDLNRFIRLQGQTLLSPDSVKIDLVKLFEEYAWLKDLLDHHDAREKVFLFPVLDRNLDEKNKTILLDELGNMYLKLPVNEVDFEI
jgi:hypothetical protein